MEINKKLESLADKKRAMFLQRYFKTQPGEYAEGDIFLGIQVPRLRELSREFANLQLQDIQELLNSKIHEKRLIALIILVNKYKKANNEERKKIFDFYLKNTRNINNWDLVDLSCRDIVGNYLLDKDKEILYKLAKSKNLWERRIAIISTFEFIRYNKFEDTIKLSELLLKDKHDLIHKAVGWALREVGKRDKAVLVNFLNKYYKNMPRTMLRYSIEKFDEKKRKAYLINKI